MKRIRNFSIIAHIDHGKSTFSDRLIHFCTYSNQNKNFIRVLDSMDLERERGITIKSQSVTLNYKSNKGKLYQLNLIDTPGHVDFSYEVSRSLTACEGALLIIDAKQGIESQTISNYLVAKKMNLKILPILNKIDLIDNDYNSIKYIEEEIQKNLEINNSNIMHCSAKTGYGIDKIIEKIINDIPSPQGNPNKPLQALILDSWFDNYFGIVFSICIKNGTIKKGNKIKIIGNNKIYTVNRLGIFNPKLFDRNELYCGEVGWIICGIRDLGRSPVGETITLAENAAIIPLFGFKKIKPLVFVGLFPNTNTSYEIFRNALEKLSLNDPSLFYEPDNSNTLGFGFRCGFLGILHMEIIKERLKREYCVDVVVTSPTVKYEILTDKNRLIYIDNPSQFPNKKNIIEIREPIAECHILFPQIYLGDIINLCIQKRGVQIKTSYFSDQIMLIYDIPMSEIITDFFNKIKSISHGYASLDYNFKYFKRSDIVKVDVLINKVCIDILSVITHRLNVMKFSLRIINKLKKFIPRQQFDISAQVSINNRIISRYTIKQLRKNVTAKCYGGDVTRKKKLLAKQKEGKKRLRQIGNIKLNQTIFLDILSTKENIQ